MKEIKNPSEMLERIGHFGRSMLTETLETVDADCGAILLVQNDNAVGAVQFSARALLTHGADHLCNIVATELRQLADQCERGRVREDARRIERGLRERGFKA